MRLCEVINDQGTKTFAASSIETRLEISVLGTHYGLDELFHIYNFILHSGLRPQASIFIFF